LCPATDTEGNLPYACISKIAQLPDSSCFFRQVCICGTLSLPRHLNSLFIWILF
jgi:hypothetical protein